VDFDGENMDRSSALLWRKSKPTSAMPVASRRWMNSFERPRTLADTTLALRCDQPAITLQEHGSPLLRVMTSMT
jgi:hypothetical protein